MLERRVYGVYALDKQIDRPCYRRPAGFDDAIPAVVPKIPPRSFRGIRRSTTYGCRHYTNGELAGLPPIQLPAKERETTFNEQKGGRPEKRK